MISQAAEDANVGAVQKVFKWRELAVLLSGYEYAAIVLVDSRYLYPAYSAPRPSQPPAASLSSTPPVLTAAPDDEAAAGRAGTPGAAPLSSDPLSGYQGAAPPASAARNRGNAESGSSCVSVDAARDAAVGSGGRQGIGEASRAGEISRPAAGSRRRRRRGERLSTQASHNWSQWETEEMSARARAAVVSEQKRTSGRAWSSGPIVYRRRTGDSVVPDVGDNGVSLTRCPWPPRSGRKRLRARPVDDAESAEAEIQPEWNEWASYSSSSSSAGLEEMTTPTSPAQGVLPELCSSPRPTKKALVESAASPLRSSATLPKVSSAPALCAPVCTTTATTPAGSPRTTSVASSPGSDVGPLSTPSSPPPPTSSAYCGHYILLVGWSEADGVFIARDPALPSSPPIAVSAEALGAAATAATIGRRNAEGGVTSGPPADDPQTDAHHIGICLTPEALDRARRSYGTDEDVLVIDLARSRRGGVTAGPLAAAAAATALTVSAATSAAATSALVGLLAMAAAAAAGAEASGFRESMGWPDPVTWFAKHGGGGDGAKRGPEGGRTVDQGGVGGMGLPEGGAESAARRLASMLSLAASGFGFTSVAEAAENRQGSGDAPGDGDRERGAGDGVIGAESASKRLASMLSLAASQLRFPTVTIAGENENNRTAAMSREARARAESAARRLAGLMSVAASGFKFPSVGDSYGVGARTAGGAGGSTDGEGERWADRVAHALEGLLEGGRWGSRRAAETMEGFFEGGRRAATQLRDSLADMADAPGGAGWEDFHPPLPSALAAARSRVSSFDITPEEIHQSSSQETVGCVWECGSMRCEGVVGSSVSSDAAAAAAAAAARVVSSA